MNDFTDVTKASAAAARTYAAACILECVTAAYEEKMESDPELLVEDDFEASDFDEAWEIAERYMDEPTVEFTALLKRAWRKAIGFASANFVHEDQRDFELHCGQCVCYEIFRWIAAKHFKREMPQ